MHFKTLCRLTIFTCSLIIFTTSFANEDTFNPAIVNNGVGMIVYSHDSFSGTGEITNFINYLKTAKMQNVNIIYVDGFEVQDTGNHIASINNDPTTIANYKSLSDALHAIGKTVILMSALPAYNAANPLSFASDALPDLANIVYGTDGMNADGLAFDYETSLPKDAVNQDYIEAVSKTAFEVIEHKKYFGIITNKGKEENSIAPIFSPTRTVSGQTLLTCKTNPTATNYCFESLMRYDAVYSYKSQTDDKYFGPYTLWSGLAFIGHLHMPDYYQGNNNTLNQPIIRLMLPGSYSGYTFPVNTASADPSFPSRPTVPDASDYTYHSFICDLTRITSYLRTLNFNSFTADCPASQTNYYTSSASIGLNFTPNSTKLFAGAASGALNANTFVFGGFDSYRSVNAFDAANSLTEKKTAKYPHRDPNIGDYHYVCHKAATVSYNKAFACKTDLPSQQNQNRLPNTDDFSIFLKANAPLPLKITPHFVSDTQQAFVITGGQTNDTCTLTVNPDSGNATPTNITLTNGAYTTTQTMSDVSASPLANGEQDSVALVCNNSGRATADFTRYGDKARLTFTNSASQTFIDKNIFSLTKNTTPVQSLSLAGGSYTVNIEPSKLNNTNPADCDSSGYCDSTVTPYIAPTGNLTIDGNQNIAIGFYKNTASKSSKGF